MTVSQGIVAYQKAVGDKLAGNEDLSAIVTGITDQFGSGLKLPYIVFGPVEPLYDFEMMDDTNGTSVCELRITLWLYDDAPSKLRTLHALQHVEEAMDSVLTLDYGVCVSKPQIIVKRSEADEVLQLWRTPVELRQIITNI